MKVNYFYSLKRQFIRITTAIDRVKINLETANKLKPLCKTVCDLSLPQQSVQPQF